MTDTGVVLQLTTGEVEALDALRVGWARSPSGPSTGSPP